MVTKLTEWLVRERDELTRAGDALRVAEGFFGKLFYFFAPAVAIACAVGLATHLILLAGGGAPTYAGTPTYVNASMHATLRWWVALLFYAAVLLAAVFAAVVGAVDEARQ